MTPKGFNQVVRKLDLICVNEILYSNTWILKSVLNEFCFKISNRNLKGWEPICDQNVDGHKNRICLMFFFFAWSVLEST